MKRIKIKGLSKVLLYTFLTSVICIHGLAQTNTMFENSLNLQLLTNDKEEKSLIVSKTKIRKLKAKYSQSSQQNLKDIFYKAVSKIKSDRLDRSVCDLGLINHFVQDLRESGFNTWGAITKDKVKELLYLLRSNNNIDDVFLGLLLDLNKLKFDLDLSQLDSSIPNTKLKNSDEKIFKKYGLSLYTMLTNWPDEEQSCSLAIWNNIAKSTKKNDLDRLNLIALAAKVISPSVYKKVEVLRKSKILKRKIYLMGYLQRVFLTKNSMKPKNIREYKIPIEEEKKFNSKKASLFKGISKREAFLQKYDDKQIIVLANILKNASKRMGSDPDYSAATPIIYQEITYKNDDGEYVTEREEYPLDNASDQYDYARKRMRIEIYETRNFTNFAGREVTYQDVIMAALETGYISHEEIQIALIYDDLWNKKESKLMQALSFTMSLSSIGVYFLPPPYNIIGAIGLTLINAKVLKQNEGKNNDNPMSLFN